MTDQTDRRAFIQTGLALGALAAATAPAVAQTPPKLPPKLSTHALDTYTGKQAAGIRIDLYAVEGDSRKLLKSVRANEEGRVTENLLDENNIKVGRYEIVFHVAEYYKRTGVPQTAPEFLDERHAGAIPRRSRYRACMKSGRYQVVAHVGDYYKKIGAKVPAGYYTKLILEFDIFDPKQPHHLPFQITPWTQSASVLPG